MVVLAVNNERFERSGSMVSLLVMRPTGKWGDQNNQEDEERCAEMHDEGYKRGILK
jgi:hypothetical protein